MGFDPASPGFYDAAPLEKEYRRIMDICHTCRRCYNLCPSFDVIFKALDRPEVDGEVDRVPRQDLNAFTDLCYECKLCIPHCPYYPPHRWEVDIPRLVLRDRAVRVRAEGKPTLRDRILSSTDAVGKIATKLAPLVNFGARNSFSRFLGEKVAGVHRKRLLPSFQSRTFERWWDERGGARRLEDLKSGDAVVLFVTCAVNSNFPRIGKAAVAVLEKNGVQVVIPPQRCCGMPFLDAGDLDSALENLRFNVNALTPFVQNGLLVVTTGPTCSLTLKKEYPVLSHDEAARAVGLATRDLSEYLMRRHADGRLATDFRKSAGKVLYQVACHLKVQDIGFKSRDLLALIPGTEIETVEKCTGHDGTWSMKAEYFDLSMKIGEPVFEQIRASSADAIATDCPLAGVQINQGTGTAPRHPLEILADCYGLSVDG
jgi:glycerol-3-phosphate dehydrogenase subunit C